MSDNDSSLGPPQEALAVERGGAGRPLKFATPQELQSRIDGYFASAADEEGLLVRPVSITGLALWLDTTRETLMDYQHRDEFSDTVKRAKLRVENFYEERLTVGRQAAGPIFALKNFGWRDEQQHALSGPDGGPIRSNAAVSLAITPESVKAIVQQVRDEF
jgi:DNA-packaging protein gp3